MGIEKEASMGRESGADRKIDLVYFSVFCRNSSFVMGDPG
jgi:hypothetical protein